MITKVIDPAGTLGERELAVLKAKLGNPDGISAIPVKVKGGSLCIGIDDGEFAGDWEFIGRKLGYRVHTV
jgi:hypothetical protein